MTRQMTRTNEGTMTYLTFIWFGTGMCSLMDNGCFVPGKCFITMAARIWSLARIYLIPNDIFEYMSARSKQYKKSEFDCCLRVRLWMANVFEPANDLPHSLHTYGLKKNIIHENYPLSKRINSFLPFACVRPENVKISKILSWELAKTSGKLSTHRK